ncbi:hypothetical protein ACLOJK_001076 [Asimina triloba]
MRPSSSRSGRNVGQAVVAWVRRQPPKVKAFLAVIAGMATLVFLRFVVHDHDNLFVAAEASHAIGISVLIYKLIKERTCAELEEAQCLLGVGLTVHCVAGLSLKSQELTAIFLAVRLYCSFVMEYDIHTLLDSATLATTLWVIYMIRFKLRSSYMEDKDNFPIYYVVCARTYTEIVESFTAHYVFALGVARFLSCAHWVLQVMDSRGYLLTALGHGLWPSMVLLSEIVQTFILADFCYYYVQSFLLGVQSVILDHFAVSVPHFVTNDAVQFLLAVLWEAILYCGSLLE